MSSKFVSMRRQRFACARLSHPYLTRSLPRLLTMTFTTAAFDRSSSWRFEASSYKATSKGPPSSPVQHDACASSSHNPLDELAGAQAGKTHETMPDHQRDYRRLSFRQRQELSR